MMIYVIINGNNALRGFVVESAKRIKELRESIGLNRKEFSEHIGIPVRTLEDWEAGRRTPPEYIPKLIAYQLKYEELIQKLSDTITLEEYVAEGDGANERS